MTVPQPIDVAVVHRQIIAALRAAELQVARLQGKLELLQELLAPPIVTEGTDAPAPSDRGPWIQPPEEPPQ